MLYLARYGLYTYPISCFFLVSVPCSVNSTKFMSPRYVSYLMRPNSKKKSRANSPWAVSKVGGLKSFLPYVIDKGASPSSYVQWAGTKFSHGTVQSPGKETSPGKVTGHSRTGFVSTPQDNMSHPIRPQSGGICYPRFWTICFPVWPQLGGICIHASEQYVSPCPASVRQDLYPCHRAICLSCPASVKQYMYPCLRTICFTLSCLSQAGFVSTPLGNMSCPVIQLQSQFSPSHKVGTCQFSGKDGLQL